MKTLTLVHTVRGKLLFLALGIEIVMLVIMVANSIRLLNNAMTSQAQWQAAQIAPILNAAIKAPVAQQDYSTIQAVLDESRTTNGIDYIVVSDISDTRIAASGWDLAKPLPSSPQYFTLFDSTQEPRFNTAVEISFSGQKLGTLYFGLNLRNIITARSTLLTQGIMIAFLEIVLSTIILMLIGLWLTRHLTKLTQFSLDVATGNLTPPPVPEGTDDIGQLGRAFNTMSQNIAERVNELTIAKETAELNEKAKSESEERLKLVLDGSNDGIWDWDIQTGRIEINRRWAEMLGYKVEEIDRNVATWANLVHPDDIAMVQKVLKDHLDGIIPLYETEHRIKSKNGEWVWVLDRGKVVLRDENGVPLRAAGTHTDITGRKKTIQQLHEQTVLLELEIAERQKAQEELAVKQLQLEVLNNSLQQRIAESIAEIREKDQVMISQSRQAAMGEMIGNIAHQWRQPLNALAMVLGNINSAYQYNELDGKYLENAVANGNRLIQKMSTTINDFRNFFLPDKEKVVFSALEQIKQSITLVEDGLKSNNISVILEAPYDVQLLGFPNEYSQVLLNLFSNARDAMLESNSPQRIINIQLEKQGNFGVITFSDSGPGIPDKIISKIFEPYFSTKKMGTGIGLYMSKTIIERSMNGILEVENKASGTAFTIKTPLEENNHAH